MNFSKKIIKTVDRLWSRAFFALQFPFEARLIATIRSKKLTYCGYPKLENLSRAVSGVRRRKVPGMFIEAGCALGGSAIFLAKTKPVSENLFVFDVFKMIPPPGEQDGPDAHARYAEIASGLSRGLGEDPYYGYEKELKNKVIKNLNACGVDLKVKKVALVEGLFSETLRPQEPVALAHIDCDWYDSVKTCLERIDPFLSRGGVMVLDDYGSYSGCQKAVDEFLAGHSEYHVENTNRSITLVKSERTAGRYNCGLQDRVSWDERAEAAVKLWNGAASVGALNRLLCIGDFGCGNGRLEDVLKQGLKNAYEYFGYDRFPQKEGVLAIDLENIMPARRHDLVFCLGLVEYLEDPEKFFLGLSRITSQAVVSAVVSDLGAYSRHDARDRGWRNYASAASMEALFQKCGFLVNEKTEIKQGKTMLWLLDVRA